MSTFPTVEEWIAKGIADAQRADPPSIRENIEESYDEFVEALTPDPLRNFICFVSPDGSRKRICRHKIEAVDTDEAARIAAASCTTGMQEEVEVEVYVHSGVLYRYELTAQREKK